MTQEYWPAGFGTECYAESVIGIGIINLIIGIREYSAWIFENISIEIFTINAKSKLTGNTLSRNFNSTMPGIVIRIGVMSA